MIIFDLQKWVTLQENLKHQRDFNIHLFIAWKRLQEDSLAKNPSRLMEYHFNSWEQTKPKAEHSEMDT